MDRLEQIQQRLPAALPAVHCQSVPRGSPQLVLGPPLSTRPDCASDYSGRPRPSQVGFGVVSVGGVGFDIIVVVGGGVGVVHDGVGCVVVIDAVVGGGNVVVIIVVECGGW